MPKRTYLDSGVLLAAFRMKEEIGRRAMEILDDPDRTLVVSDAVWLEVMPKPLYQGEEEEVSFYCTIFADAERYGWNLEVLSNAQRVAEQYGIAAMDAIHVAHALEAGVDEFVTSEKPTKPLFRAKGITLRSIQVEGLLEKNIL